MGDRANVFMKGYQEEPGVFMYTHWSGYDLPVTVQRALQKRWRWSDPQYLARIIFCEMIKGQEDRETGYGLSAVVGDGDYRVVQVDAYTQTVTFGKASGTLFIPEGNTYSFDEYVSLNLDGWE